MDWDLSTGIRVYVVTADYNDTNVTVISRADGVPETLPISVTSITDIYVNHTLEAQPVDYTFTPRIYDTREGYEGALLQQRRYYRQDLDQSHT